MIKFYNKKIEYKENNACICNMNEENCVLLIRTVWSLLVGTRRENDKLWL